MARKKLQRFAEVKQMPNIIDREQAGAEKIIRAFLAEAKYIVLELGCGKGEYTVALAHRNHRAKFIGVDIQGERLWHGAKRAQALGLNNVIFLREQVENLDRYIGPQKIDEIWLNFPDPFLRKKYHKKRLVSPRFLTIYKQFLKTRHLIHLKTDDETLWQYAQEMICQEGGRMEQKIDQLAIRNDPDKAINFQTFYEKKYRANGQNIHYLCFSLPIDKQ